MNDKINILFLIDHFHLAGGTETHLAYLARHLDKERFKCFIVAFSLGAPPLLKQLRDDGIEVVHIHVGRYYTLNAVLKAVELSKFIGRNKIDIVQTYHFKSDTYGALIAWLSGVKYIISSKRDVGDLKSKLHYFINRRLRRIFNGVIVVADAVGYVVERKEKIPRKKIKTIYNGVDLNRFSPPDSETVIQERKKLGFTSKDFIVGTVAWLRPEKNYDVFFSAIKILQASIKNLKVIVVGGGALLDYFKEYTKEADIAGIVHFIGPSNDVRPYLRVMDIACLVPGKNEGFSNSILEKMAMGLPLVVTDVGGNAEAVQNGYNGLVIPPNDAQSLTNAVSELYNQPERRKAMGKKSREMVTRKFTLELMIQNHALFYEGLMIE